MDASGRAGVTETDEMVEVPADTVIVAVGEKVPAEFYEANGINVNERGKAKLDQETLETSVKDVYLAGDSARGAATIVEAIRDAQLVAKAILGREVVSDRAVTGTETECYEKKGVLKERRALQKKVKDVFPAARYVKTVWMYVQTEQISPLKYPEWKWLR